MSSSGLIVDPTGLDRMIQVLWPSNAKSGIVMNEQYMKRAFELAEKGRGRTSPNPLVGAVIVKDGAIVGEGFHEVVGGPHAEINALAVAKESGAGAIMYVTLEPCCNYGRTPPCTEALKAARISEVIVGLRDPNPTVSGKGIEELEAAGIRVECGFLEEEIAHQNEVYIKHITTGYPFVLTKTAMTLDGKIAFAAGERSSISSKTSQNLVHDLRAEYDAILVGIGTVLIDDPLLTARPTSGDTRKPLRVIVDSRLRIGLDSQIAKTAGDIETIVAHVSGEESKKRALEQTGIEVLEMPGSDGRVDLKALLRKLGDRGIASVLCEGGSKLNGSILKAGLIDKLLIFVAPMLIGNSAAPAVVDFDAGGVDEALRINIAGVSMSDSDLIIEAYPAGKDAKRSAAPKR